MARCAHYEEVPGCFVARPSCRAEFILGDTGSDDEHRGLEII